MKNTKKIQELEDKIRELERDLYDQTTLYIAAKTDHDILSASIKKALPMA